MSDELSTSSRGRQRVYASASEKVSAFRERNKEAGLLRKEVLVQADIAARLSELAREQGTSVTNVASGLLEMGLNHFEALQSLGYVAGRACSPSSELAVSERASESARGVAGTQGVSGVSGVSGAMAGAPAPAEAWVSGAALEAHAQSAGISVQHGAQAGPALQVPNPIANFFEKRKNLPK